MAEQKNKPGRPRKWSSDAERMRVARAAKREERRAAEERRDVRREQNERRARETYATAATSQSIGEVPEPATPDDCAPEHSALQAEIDRLRAEVRRLEDEYDDVVYDRWILETQYRMAIHRLQKHDLEGLAWLDEQRRRWAQQREGEPEDRRRARRSWQIGQL